jgi:mycothiol synthase
MPGLDVRTTSTLSAPEATAVQLLVDAAAELDDVTALNEAGLLNLEHSRSGVQHLMVVEEQSGVEELLGYGQLQLGDPESTGQLVVAPTARRRGIGTALVRRLLELAPGPLGVWALQDTPAAQALAARVGLVPARELLVMTRPLEALPAAAPLPAGVRVRTFVPGQDEDAWLRVNARAFASHPEQGAVDNEDLAERMAEAWFDPDGFFLAENDTGLVGFHWTKRHSAVLGEVYVLGVDPAAGGAGLGGALLDLGLVHLREAGLREVELYVEGDHERAVALYRGRGFSTASRDVMYARPRVGARSTGPR